MNQSDTTVAEIIAAERAWVEAHRHLNLDALEWLMADDYVAIWEDGAVVDKEAELAAYRIERHWEMVESDEYDVRVFGETAVLVGRWRAKGINNGHPFDYTARFLSVYVWRNGRWQIATSQSTPIRHDPAAANTK